MHKQRMNTNSILQTSVPKIPGANSLDYLYQAISLIETKNYQASQQCQPQQQHQQTLSQPNMAEYASNLISENKKRIIGNLIYQNQQQLPTPQTLLANNENFSLANHHYNNKINPSYITNQNKIMPSCSCCTLNQYSNPYLYQKQPIKKEDKRINNPINKQMHLKDVETHKFPTSRLEKAKQFARNAEYQSSTSPVHSSNSNSPVQQFQNQYYPIDVLYTLLPMYLNPYLNKQNVSQQQQVDPAYIQSLVSFVLNQQQQQQHQQKYKPQYYQQAYAPTNSNFQSNKTSMKPNKPIKTKITHLDVNSKVEEHFKRSLGNDYLNYVPNKRVKLNQEYESLPESPCSIKTVSSNCSSPVLNINETSNESIILDETKSRPVDNHFSKALGVDMWNKIKDKIHIDTDNSSDIMSETSISPVKL